MGRTASEWGQKPPLPETHFVDSLIYTDEGIFEEEKERIFAKTWMLACHESELPEPNDYRTYHPAGVNLIVVHGEDDEIRSFYNVCPHRGNTVLYSPSGNAKRMTCIFHAWSFDYLENCVGLPREKAGYCSGDDCSITRENSACVRSRLRSATAASSTSISTTSVEPWRIISGQPWIPSSSR
jgi:methanesulfonate monooxygenase subunit alpha